MAQILIAALPKKVLEDITEDLVGQHINEQVDPKNGELTPNQCAFLEDLILEIEDIAGIEI